MKKYLTVIIFLILSINSWARPRIINFDKELKNAEIVRFGKVLSYSDSTLKFVHSETNDTLIFNCKGKFMADDLRQRSLEINPKSKELEGYWPQQNEAVLIIADASMNVRLIAKKENENYRFWNPNMDLLGSWFHFSSPALPVQICGETFPDNDYSNNCFDGCLFPINMIKEK